MAGGGPEAQPCVGANAPEAGRAWPAVAGGAVQQAVTAFAAHIRAGAPFPRGWYTLPGDIFFLGKEHFGSALKIRDSYNNLYQDLNSTDDSGSLKLRQVVVSGASGVGTSLFLVFYLLRRLHEGKAVLWHAPANQQSALYYHFTPSRGGARVQRVTERVAQQLLESEQGVYYAVNGMEPLVPIAFRWSQAVVAAQAHHTHGGNCSEHSHLPDLKDCRRFLCAERNSTIQLLLPLWQDDEVLDLRKFAYPGMTEHQVRDRLSRCKIYFCMRGIPRAIFVDRFDQFA